MLTIAEGKCEKCGMMFKDFQLLTEQEVTLECGNCGKEVRYCRNCKSLGCPQCGGDLVNTFDRRPDILH